MVIDPFGGVALGALEAMRLGLRWRGVELEEKFVQLGQANLKLWKDRFGSMPAWSNDAFIYQGDSRNLAEILYTADSVIPSPPYGEASRAGGGIAASLRGETDYPLPNGHTGSNQGYHKPSAAISSPPFRQATGGTPEPKPGGSIDQALYNRHAAGNSTAEGYGVTPGQLANMKDQDFTLALSSPPYAGTEVSTAGNQADAETRKRMRAEGTWQGYNLQNPSNLGSKKDGDFTAAISSPPFEGNPQAVEKLEGKDQAVRSNPRHPGEKLYFTDYEKQADSASLGVIEGDGFWTAARQIVDQVYTVLSPGGHAVWVVKGFVRNKKLNDFPGQWQQLCQAAGFIPLHEHHALLIRHKGTSITLEGEDVKHVTESKSFFRRLAESKGSPRIDFETVLCMGKI
jgi:hypothetical protein